MSADVFTTISLRISADELPRFDRIAETVQKDRSWVIHRALGHYLRDEGHDLLEEIEGVAQLDRGEGVDFEEVLIKAERIIEEAKARRSSSGGPSI